MDLGRVPGSAGRSTHGRHSLRHEVVEARHPVGGRVGRRVARRGRNERRLRHRVLGRRIYDEPPARRRARWSSVGGVRLRRRRPRARARRSGPAAGPAPVLLEERQVGPRLAAQRGRRAGLLGERRLSQLRRSVARTALLGRLKALRWLVATVAETIPETARTTTLRLDVPDWPGHRAGQDVDVRLTAEDGYTAQRSYSVASAPGAERLELTVVWIDDGEVSPYLASVAEVGDQFELRGPIGGWFVWDADDSGPVLLVGGGSGVVPLVAMMRYHAQLGSAVPMHLVYSTRRLDDVIYRDELP